MPQAKTHTRIKSALYEYSTNLHEPVKLRLDSSPYGSIPPISIPDMFEKSVDDFPHKPALSFKDESGQWQILTYLEYKAKVYHIAKAFIKLGLQPRDTIIVTAFNCPEWFFTELGAIYAGGIIAGSYTTNSTEAVFHILSTSKAKLVVADDIEQMKKIREIWSRLPHLKSVIQINGPFESDLGQTNGYYKWSDLEQMDTTQQDIELESRINNIAVNECCMLTYTSGTIGLPKAAMLSHDNITWDVKCVEERYGNVVRGEETTVSYLPMSHVAAQMVDIFLPMSEAGCVYFADQDALKGSLIKTLQNIHPTRIMAVPRVYEKIHEQLIKMEAQLPKFQKILLAWARKQSLCHYKDLMEGKQSESWQYTFAKRFVLDKIKHSLGLDKIRTMLGGGAPLSVDLKTFFLSIDLPITEVFGMTESTGGHCMTNSAVSNLQTVGPPLVGIPTKIHNPDETGAGEICLRSRSVFMGYLNDPEKTKEAIDEDGWLHTGDLGTMDEKGYVYITGRLKEIIITAGGENIAPVHVENLVKSQLPIISNAVLIGDKRKYLTILITLKVEVNIDTGAPSDKLLPIVREWLETLNLSYTTVSEILEAGPCPIVLKAIEDGISRANQNAISQAQKIQKFAVLPQDFSMASGELGPTLKLKRNVVASKYRDVIEEMYS